MAGALMNHIGAAMRARPPTLERGALVRINLRNVEILAVISAVLTVHGVRDCAVQKLQNDRARRPWEYTSKSPVRRQPAFHGSGRSRSSPCGKRCEHISPWHAAWYRAAPRAWRPFLLTAGCHILTPSRHLRAEAFSPAWPRNVRVGANSPNLWPTISSVTYTGTCLRPS